MAPVKIFLNHLTIEKQLFEILKGRDHADFIGLVVSSDTTSVSRGDN